MDDSVELSKYAVILPIGEAYLCMASYQMSLHITVGKVDQVIERKI